MFVFLINSCLKSTVVVLWHSDDIRYSEIYHNTNSNIIVLFWIVNVNTITILLVPYTKKVLWRYHGTLKYTIAYKQNQIVVCHCIFTLLNNTVVVPWYFIRYTTVLHEIHHIVYKVLKGNSKNSMEHVQKKKTWIPLFFGSKLY